MVALLMLALHWCNPVAWIAYRAYRADQEQACDARVLALHGRDQAHIYGRAILKAAGGRQFAGACHLSRVDALKGRLKMLSAHEISLRRISWGMGAVALLTATGLALTASGGGAARQVAAITQKVDAMDFGRLSDLVVRPASASEPWTPPPPETATETPQPEADRQGTEAVDGLSPPPPLAPPAPVADSGITDPFALPAPPARPAPPQFLRDEEGRIIPSEAEIRRHIPHVDVASGCEEGKSVNQSETVDERGQRHVRVRICEAQLAAQARRAARAGLKAARAQVAAAARMTEKMRAEVLRDMDKELAKLDERDD